MKNGERPINPILDLNEDKSGLRGLTKREYFAGLAMQGFCACPNLEISREGLAIESVRQADELLKQLQND